MNHSLSSSQYTLLYVSPSKDGTIIPVIRQPRESPAHVRRGEVGWWGRRVLGGRGGSGNDLPKSVIHYCQVHGLLKKRHNRRKEIKKLN